MWFFKIAPLGALALVTGCQRLPSAGADLSDAGAPDQSAAASSADVDAPSSRCGAPDICLESPSTASAACDAGLAVLLASGKLSAPARCEVLIESDFAEKDTQRAAVLRFRQADFGQPYWVAMGDSAGYQRIVELMNVSGGVNTSLDLRITHLAFEDLVAGGLAELRIELQSTVDDHDCSGEFSWHTQRTDLGICGMSALGSYCIAPLPLTLRRFETLYDPRTDREASQLIEAYGLDVSFESDALLVRTRSGSIPGELTAVVGRHAFPAAARLARDLPFPH